MLQKIEYLGEPFFGKNTKDHFTYSVILISFIVSMYGLGLLYRSYKLFKSATFSEISGGTGLRMTNDDRIKLNDSKIEDNEKNAKKHGFFPFKGDSVPIG